MTTISHPKLERLDRDKFGWADSDAAGASARRGLSAEVVHDISARLPPVTPGTLAAVGGGSPCLPPNLHAQLKTSNRVLERCW